MTSFLTVIYDPQLGVQSSEGVQRRFQQTPASATQAANDAEAAMAYCRDEVLPELVSCECSGANEHDNIDTFHRMLSIVMWYAPCLSSRRL